ncbi:hypothetical protein AB0I10_29800 [Streptomyces sp. NPDC050636]|uniref:hypothetical protein n=1 Tax=Streptomyces sp. NPDC050636 TaxID=3154510 RepID=UPI0034147B20
MQEPTSGPEPEAAAGSHGPAVSDVHAESAATVVSAVSAGPAGVDGPAGDAAPAAPVESAGPQPLGIVLTPTGDATVDARLRRLADADHLPAAGHLDVYEDVHRGLRDALAALDQRPGPPAPSAMTRDTTTYDNRS